jgi:NADPH-dependent F420 reductase
MKVSNRPLIGVVGGTGKLGEALARRWLKAGHNVMIGSRTADKAMLTAAALSAETNAIVTSGSNAEVAEKAELVVITVPFSAQAETLNDIREEVQGKIVVDTTVPLMPPKVMRVQLPPEGSAALKAQSILGDGVRLVSAFHSVAAHRLATDDEIACDVMVFGDEKPARDQIVALANDAGLRGIHAGALVNSVAAEALTSILIFVNKAYSVDGAGIQFTGDLNF